MRSFPRILLWASLLYVLVLNRAAPISAAPDPVIRVEPYSTLAQVGQMFTVNVTLADVQNLYGIEVVLNWNASVIKIVGTDVRLGVESYLDGVLHEPIFLAKNETLQEQGKYTLAAASTVPAASFNGSGNIARITFNVTNDGSSDLNLETKLADKPPPGGVASPITHRTIDGFFGRMIRVSLSRTVIVVGEEVNISGFIIPAQADVEVTIAYRHYGETDWRLLSPTTRTDDQGNYRFVWQPQEARKYEIKTTAVIEGREEMSALVFLTVEASEQTPVWQYVAIAMAIVIIIVVVAMVIMYRRKPKRKLLARALYYGAL